MQVEIDKDDTSTSREYIDKGDGWDIYVEKMNLGEEGTIFKTYFRVGVQFFCLVNQPGEIHADMEQHCQFLGKMFAHALKKVRGKISWKDMAPEDVYEALLEAPKVGLWKETASGLHHLDLARVETRTAAVMTKEELPRARKLAERLWQEKGYEIKKEEADERKTR
jgi:hypothetical protein